MLDLKCISEISYRTDLRNTTVHRHNTYQMIFVTDGEAQITVAKRAYALGASHIALINSLEPHSLRVTGDTYKRYTLLIDPGAAHEAVKNAALLSMFTNRPEDFCHVLDVSSIADEVLFYIRRLQAEAQTDGAFPEAGVLLFRMLLITLCRFAPSLLAPHSGISGTVWEIKQTLEQNVQQEIQLNQLAEQYHISPYYLAHCFKRMTGYSIKQYQIFCRIAVAREMLADSAYSITQIAIQCGFQDMSNFSRYFRRVMNCSPSEFRRENQELTTDSVDKREESV